MSGKQDPLAYGYLPGNEESDRGSGGTKDAAKDLLKDTFHMLRGSHHRQDQPQRPTSSQGSNQPGSYQGVSTMLSVNVFRFGSQACW
jgi:hypothetical protein